MKVDFYKNTSTKNTAEKKIELLFTRNSVVLKNDCDMLNPVLHVRITGSDLNNLYKYVNYFYIDTFDRYYFVNKITFCNGYVEISGHVDVLKTYYEKGLSELYCVTRRQENRYNTYLNDSEFLCYNSPIVVQKAFPSGFSSGYSPVLIVSGGN